MRRSITTLVHATRLLAIVGALLVMLPFAAARAATPAEDFVTNNVQQGLSILGNGALSEDQKRTQFRTFLLSLADLKSFADYTLGPAIHSASPGDIATFEDAFRDYALAEYESYFAKYSGQTLKVTSSMERSPGNYIVSTVLVDPKGAAGKPVQVAFHVSNQSGRFLLKDFSVEGIDIADNIRDTFISFLGDHHNDVKALAADLKRRAANIRAGGDPKQN